MRIGEPIRVLQVEPLFYEPAEGTFKELKKENDATTESQRLLNELKEWTLPEDAIEEVVMDERSNYT